MFLSFLLSQVIQSAQNHTQMSYYFAPEAITEYLCNIMGQPSLVREIRIMLYIDQFQVKYVNTLL